MIKNKIIVITLINLNGMTCKIKISRDIAR